MVFANSLGTDLRIWDAVITAIPQDRPLHLVEKPGHGLSQFGPVSIDGLTSHMAVLMDL